MTDEHVAGMQARSRGDSRDDNPYQPGDYHTHWNEGWDRMDLHVNGLIENAQGMVDTVSRIRRRLLPAAFAESA